MAMESYLSIITLNVNVLNAPNQKTKTGSKRQTPALGTEHVNATSFGKTSIADIIIKDFETRKYSGFCGWSLKVMISDIIKDKQKETQKRSQ